MVEIQVVVVVDSRIGRGSELDVSGAGDSDREFVRENRGLIT